MLARNEHGLTALQIAFPQRLFGRRDARLETLIDHLKAAYRQLPFEGLSLVEVAKTGHFAALELHVGATPPIGPYGNRLRRQRRRPSPSGCQASGKRAMRSAADRTSIRNALSMPGACAPYQWIA